MTTIVYELKDAMDHPKYEWPLSPVRYRLELPPGAAHPDGFELRDEGGHSVPMQVIGPELREGFVTSGELVFLADLPRGATRRYTLRCRPEPLSAEPAGKEEGRASVVPDVVACGEGDSLVFGNGLLDIRVPRTGAMPAARALPGDASEMFRLMLPNGNTLAIAGLSSGQRISAFESECVSSGPVMHEQRIGCVFDDGGRYSALLRLVAGMPYIELEEKMGSIASATGAALEILWVGLEPGQRYTRYRGEEATDAYLGDRGELPFRILPYDNARSWHRGRSVAFTDEARQLTAGLFLGDAMQWQDGEYALWRSSDTLAIGFRYGKAEFDLPSAGEHEARLIWRYPLSNGTRATKIALFDADRKRAANASWAFRSPEVDAGEPLIEQLALWHGLLPLDKVKDWVLEWEEPQTQYPLLFSQELLPETFHWWYFNRHTPPQASDLEAVVDKLSFSFNHVEHTSPVTSREFASWTPMFDLSASSMTPEQFRRLKAASALMAYVREDEQVAPIHTMLAGHPNFLADFKAVPGFMSALFPHHPHAGRWREHFEKAVALNLKYHTRPDVAAWQAEGGRWTENLGCYVWAALVPMIRAAWCLRRTYGDNPLLYPNLAKLAKWLLNSLSAPLPGGRSYPPQGAHAGALRDPFHPPYVLRVLGDMLQNYDPLLADQLLAVCPADADGFGSEEADGIWRSTPKRLDGGIWRSMLESPTAAAPGTPPQLASAKFTGYGFVLRAAVGTPGEMSVHLQQIDEGPNYRWGRSGAGGNGVIYYYAEGKRYSYHRPEDVGDDNMAAGEGSSSFAVLSGHEYASIGRNELTGPLHDFGFAQFASLQAGPAARPMYRSRSVIMSGNDYILIFDEVADMRVRGRFSWFTHRDEDFPGIYQLKPGAAASSVQPGGPVDAAPVPPGGYARPGTKIGYPNGSKGRYYDGFGHFLTVVTHRETWQPQLTGVQATGYGAIVSLCGRTDYLFRDASRIRHDDGVIRFDGYAGIVRSYGSGHAEAALFCGRSIGAAGIVASVRAIEDAQSAEAAAIAFTLKNGDLRGQSSSSMRLAVELEVPAALSDVRCRLYVDGQPLDGRRSEEGGRCVIRFELPPGRHSWQWTDRAAAPGPARGLQAHAVSGDTVDLVWESAAAADRYELAVSEDGCRSWRTVANGAVTLEHQLHGLKPGTKLHWKVRAWNGPEAGPWSEARPFMATDRPPAVPEGLRLQRQANGGVAATWGRTLGARTYRLYRRRLDEKAPTLIHESGGSEYIDRLAGEDAIKNVYAYSVSAVNGNGESARSPERDTLPGGLIDWDPRPEEGFKRYVRSHEYGYNGFDYWNNDNLGSLPPYPSQNEREEAGK